MITELSGTRNRRDSENYYPGVDRPFSTPRLLVLRPGTNRPSSRSEGSVSIILAKGSQGFFFPFIKIPSGRETGTDYDTFVSRSVYSYSKGSRSLTELFTLFSSKRRISVPSSCSTESAVYRPTH